MSRKMAIAIILISAVSMFAQKRPYDQIMKEVAPTFANLKKNLDTSAFPAAAQDAAKLEALFKETENFWAPFKTKDALDFSKGAAVAASAVAAAANEGNGQKAQAAYASVGKYCKGCHDSHRELMPDKSYRIKP